MQDENSRGKELIYTGGKLPVPVPVDDNDGLSKPPRRVLEEKPSALVKAREDCVYGGALTRGMKIERRIGYDGPSTQVVVPTATPYLRFGSTDQVQFRSNCRVLVFGQWSSPLAEIPPCTLVSIDLEESMPIALFHVEDEPVDPIQPLLAPGTYLPGAEVLSEWHKPPGIAGAVDWYWMLRLDEVAGITGSRYRLYGRYPQIDPNIFYTLRDIPIVGGASIQEVNLPLDIEALLNFPINWRGEVASGLSVAPTAQVDVLIDHIAWGIERSCEKSGRMEGNPGLTRYQTGGRAPDLSASL